jgi:hypothetical protein
VKDEPKFTDVTAEKKIEFFHKAIESDKSGFPNMTKDDLINYILCMDIFLKSKTELDATISLKMRFGKRG